MRTAVQFARWSLVIITNYTYSNKHAQLYGCLVVAAAANAPIKLWVVQSIVRQFILSPNSFRRQITIITSHSNNRSVVSKLQNAIFFLHWTIKFDGMPFILIVAKQKRNKNVKFPIRIHFDSNERIQYIICSMCVQVAFCAVWSGMNEKKKHVKSKNWQVVDMIAWCSICMAANRLLAKQARS